MPRGPGTGERAALPNSGIISGIVNARKKKEKKGAIFASIRKPTAPSSKSFGAETREDKLDPVGRKTKHKKKEDLDKDV